MRSKAYLLVFDGLADWEAPLALCAINEKENLEVISAGFTKEPVTTMGGIKILPQITLAELNPAEACILILPGGKRWETQPIEDKLLELLRNLHAEAVPVAAICAATLAVVRAGLVDATRHTSNGKNYIKQLLPDYQAEAFYVEEPAVTDKNLITANGAAYVEFAREIMKLLKLESDEDIQSWFKLFKHGLYSQAAT
jgi:putative intracellular protease/amidase